MVAGNRQTWTSRQRPTYPTRPRLQPLLLVAPHAQGPTSQLALPLPLNPSASAQSAISLQGQGTQRGWHLTGPFHTQLSEVGFPDRAAWVRPKAAPSLGMPVVWPVPVPLLPAVSLQVFQCLRPTVPENSSRTTAKDKNQHRDRNSNEVGGISR